jgi:hypothetical protein
MLQRIQTVWLLLAAAFAFISLQTNFYVATVPPVFFTGHTEMFILILTVISGTLSLVNIFLYKNRPLQLKLTLANLGVSIVEIVFYFLALENYTSGAFALTSVVVFACPLLLLLAARGIYADQKLIKSVDRLR